MVSGVYQRATGRVTVSLRLLFVRLTVCPKNLWIHHCFLKTCSLKSCHVTQDPAVFRKIIVCGVVVTTTAQLYSTKSEQSQVLGRLKSCFGGL